MQLALAIQNGAFALSAVLAKVNSYSTRNRFTWALKELGNEVRTTYPLVVPCSLSMELTTT